VTSLSGIKAISFDVDGTIWDFDEALERGLTAALNELRNVNESVAECLSIGELDQAWQRERDELPGGVTDLNQLRHNSMRRALTDIGSPDKVLVGRMSDAYFEERNRDNRPFDDVVPALEVLHGKFKLGLLTNGNMKSNRLGLQKYFEFRVLSVEHGGIEKPDPRGGPRAARTRPRRRPPRIRRDGRERLSRPQRLTQLQGRVPLPRCEAGPGGEDDYGVGQYDGRRRIKGY
jgi:FMN phosphatase YigB (HAD superfamily)